MGAQRRKEASMKMKGEILLIVQDKMRASHKVESQIKLV